MKKEPKKSDSLVIENNTQKETEILPSSKNTAASHQDAPLPSSPNYRVNSFSHFFAEIKAAALHTQGYLKLTYATLFWLFVVASMVGLGLETIYHGIVFGGFESRAGLVWGPFSPIYGVGALALTLFLNRYYHSHNLIIFLISMLVGSFVEYCTSWMMQICWGAIAWDYTGTFGSIQGRTNFFFGMLWGVLGLLWVRFVLPIIKRIFSHVNLKSKVVRIVTLALSIFMAVNIACTCIALYREKQRADGIPASNIVQTWCDEYFPDSYLQARFENMTVTGSSSDQ